MNKDNYLARVDLTLDDVRTIFQTALGADDLIAATKAVECETNLLQLRQKIEASGQPTNAHVKILNAINRADEIKHALVQRATPAVQNAHGLLVKITFEVAAAYFVPSDRLLLLESVSSKVRLLELMLPPMG